MVVRGYPGNIPGFPMWTWLLLSNQLMSIFRVVSGKVIISLKCFRDAGPEVSLVIQLAVDDSIGHCSAAGSYTWCLSGIQRQNSYVVHDTGAASSYLLLMSRAHTTPTRSTKPQLIICSDAISGSSNGLCEDNTTHKSYQTVCAKTTQHTTHTSQQMVCAKTTKRTHTSHTTDGGRKHSRGRTTLAWRRQTPSRQPLPKI